MLYLAFIFHMHQPYYKDLLTQESSLPWVRLHATKDYLDMLQVLEKYPLVHQTFNLVPSLVEQIEDYEKDAVKDKFLEVSSKPAASLNRQEKEFLLENFFSINKERVISLFPRYYELYLKKKTEEDFKEEDYRDLQTWFNLAWIDPCFRETDSELKSIVGKARFFSEEDKQLVLEKQLGILKEIVSAYKKFQENGQIEVTLSPYYHPILPLLYNTNIAREANPKAILPKPGFSYPLDCQAQIESAVSFYKTRFARAPRGMWPSEEAVSEHILPFIMHSGINWIVADEAILFKSLRIKKRDAKILYQPYLLKREEGNLNIVFRDRNLSDLLGFVYHSWNTEKAVADFMRHLEIINNSLKGKDLFVAIAMDGENAWEYYPNDGHDFLEALYQKFSDTKFLKCVSVSEYLKKFPPCAKIKRLAAGSWIYAQFGKWIGNPYKVKAWEWLAQAREELKDWDSSDKRLAINGKRELAYKQMYILEGSDWFWWYGEEPQGHFDKLFRMHLSNFYRLIAKDPPAYLDRPLST